MLQIARKIAPCDMALRMNLYAFTCSTSQKLLHIPFNFAFNFWLSKYHSFNYVAIMMFLFLKRVALLLYLKLLCLKDLNHRIAQTSSLIFHIKCLISLSHAMRPGLKIRHFWVAKLLFLTIIFYEKIKCTIFCL